jgi:hypothetical protein
MINVAKIRNMTQKPWFYPVALLLIGFVTYGYVMPALGYYWDDWEIVMFNKLNPALQFDFYAHDRPFPWTYQLIHFLVGSAPLGWHIVTLILRWAAVLVFVQALLLLWPRYEDHLHWLGALLLVYPGFLQQSQSATKARHIMTFLLFATSIYLMVLAIKRPKWARILFPLSWLTAFLQLFTTEYFSGMELIRPVILWMLLAGEQESRGQTLRKVVKYFLPYLGITAFYFWCRLVYFPQIFHTTSRISEINSTVGDLQTSMGGSFLTLLNRALMDFIYLIGQVWINAVIEFEGFSFESRVAWFAFGVGILLTLAFAFFYSTQEKKTSGKESPASIFLLGLIAFLLGAVPVWVIGKDISSGGWADRFALAPLIGACLMVLALLLWFVRPAGQKIILGTLLVFSIAAQMWVVNQYRQDWRTQLDFYWQLYWRAPALQPGTAIISFEQPSLSVTHYADAGYAINVLYHYQTEDGTLPYWMFPRQRHFDYQPNDSFKIGQRQLTFAGNTSKAIAVLHQEKNACLRVLDTIYADDPILQGRDVLMNVTNPSLILPDLAAPPPDPEIFGHEPEHDWCYFFEKADLARQTGDWKTAISLYKESQGQGLAPSFGSEYIPFIEAYAQTGDWNTASKLTRLAMKTNAGEKKILCNTWSRLSKLPSAQGNVVDEVKQSLACSN